MHKKKITRRSVIQVGLGAISTAAISRLPLLGQAEGDSSSAAVPNSSAAADVQSATESSLANFSATAYAYSNSGPGYSLDVGSQPNEDTFLASERFAAATLQASGDPSGDLLSPVDIHRPLLAGDPEGASTSNPEQSIFAIKNSDLAGDSLALTAETFKWFSATAGEIAPPIDMAANLYGIYSSFHEQAEKDPYTSEINAGANIAFGYASGEAAAAVGELTFTVVVPVVVAYTSPVWAVPVAVIASGVTLYSSHVASNYLANVTSSVLGAAELSFAQQQAAIESALYEYSNFSPFGDNF